MIGRELVRAKLRFQQQRCACGVRGLGTAEISICAYMPLANPATAYPLFPRSDESPEKKGDLLR